MVKYDFELIEKFKNKTEFNKYRNVNRPFTIERGKKELCKMCNSQSHKMNSQYCICTNKPCLDIGVCPAKYKITTCLKHDEVDLQKIKFFKLKDKDHNSDEIQVQTRGLSEKVKELIEDVINDYDSKPKRLFIRLSTKKKYKKQIDIQPTLVQIQNFSIYTLYLKKCIKVF